MTTGQRIKAFRKQANLTQRELAQKIGSATGTIQQYELGKREPRSSQLQKIADALNVTIPKLMGAGMTVKDKAAKPWSSNKAGRLYIPIDSKLLDNLEQLSRADGLSLEDEIEGILHDEVERRIEDK